jgi:hypothetical protein
LTVDRLYHLFPFILGLLKGLKTGLVYALFKLNRLVLKRKKMWRRFGQRTLTEGEGSIHVYLLEFKS